ncbi:MAG: tyrosine-type recombinase/integrase [Planctomycetota bacterium]
MRTDVAYVVACYLEHANEIYTSREPKNLRSSLALLVQHCRGLAPREIRAALRELEHDRTRSANYRRKVWGHWKRFLAWCVEFEELPSFVLSEVRAWRPRFPEDPAFDVTPQLRDDLTKLPERVRQTLEHLPKCYREIVQLIALTGARPSEILGLRSSDIDISSTPWVAWLSRHKTSGRSRRPRMLVFPPSAVKVLDRNLRPFTPDDWLFPSHSDPEKAVPYATLAQAIRRTNHRHKLASWQLYDLRRHAARVLRDSQDLQHAQVALGHTRASTTEIYAPARCSDLAAIAQQMEGVL